MAADLGLLQRRRLGLTVANVAAKVRELEKAGALTGIVAVDAAAVAQALLNENPELYQKEAGRDWQEFFDALISFLEKLIPLILKLIEIFGGV